MRKYEGNGKEDRGETADEWNSEERERERGKEIRWREINRVRKREKG